MPRTIGQRRLEQLRGAFRRIDRAPRGSDEEYAEMTLEELFAWGREVAQRGNITPERSREILREVRAMLQEDVEGTFARELMAVVGNIPRHETRTAGDIARREA